MTTQAQVLANRRNALKSTGPRTLRGRAAVSQNAVKHALSARQAVITSESRADFEMHRDRLFAVVACPSNLCAARPLPMQFSARTHAIIQNKPNFTKAKMTLNPYLEKHYGKTLHSCPRQNKPNQTQLPRPQTSAPLLITHVKPLYRLRNDRYYTRCMRRCSSMVEHGFRKAGVEGSSPSIGFMLNQAGRRKEVCAGY